MKRFSARPPALLGTAAATALLAGCFGVTALEPASDGWSAGLAPEHGALLGAYVDPDLYTDDGRVTAVHEFEQLIGRPLDVVQTFHPWTEPFPSAGDLAFLEQGRTLLLSWAGTDTRAIAYGQHDDLIRARAAAVAELGTPILLRWRWEMDRPNLQAEIHSATDYVAAWRHIRAIFADTGVTNAEWVWCPLADGFTERSAASYYPGDDQVDWLCADAYTRTPTVPLADILDPFLAWAEDHDKPVIIGEMGVQAGAAGERADWLATAGDYLQTHDQVRAVVYWEADPRKLGKYDAAYSLAPEPSALAAFRDLAHDDHFYTRDHDTRSD